VLFVGVQNPISGACPKLRSNVHPDARHHGPGREAMESPMTCLLCEDTGWVCELHRFPWSARSMVESLVAHQSTPIKILFAIVLRWVKAHPAAITARFQGSIR
jgi:hypothetical protein